MDQDNMTNPTEAEIDEALEFVRHDMEVNAGGISSNYEKFLARAVVALREELAREKAIKEEAFRSRMILTDNLRGRAESAEAECARLRDALEAKPFQSRDLVAENKRLREKVKELEAR